MWRTPRNQEENMNNIIENGPGKGYYGDFMEEETQRNNKYRKRCSISLAIREVEIKIMRFDFTPLGKWKLLSAVSVGKAIASGNAWNNYFGENNLTISHKAEDTYTPLPSNFTWRSLS